MTGGELEGWSEISDAEAPDAQTRCKPTPGLTPSLSNFSGALIAMQVPGPHSEEQILEDRLCGPGTGRLLRSL